MRLTKSTSHAIRILIDCARASGELTKVATLSERLGITQQNVFKIVNLLTKAGSGRGGARPPRRRAAGAAGRARSASATWCGPPRSRTWRSRKAQPAAKRGRGHGVNRILDDALEAFIEVLDQHTIADMAKTPGPRGQPPRKAGRSVRRQAARRGADRAATAIVSPGHRARACAAWCLDAAVTP